MEEDYPLWQPLTRDSAERREEEDTKTWDVEEERGGPNKL